MVLLEKANGILMETIGISVMVSIGLLLFFLAGKAYPVAVLVHCYLLISILSYKDLQLMQQRPPANKRVFNCNIISRNRFGSGYRVL